MTPEPIDASDPCNHLHLVRPTPENRDMLYHPPPARGVPGCPSCELIVRGREEDDT